MHVVRAEPCLYPESAWCITDTHLHRRFWSEHRRGGRLSLSETTDPPQYFPGLLRFFVG